LKGFWGATPQHSLFFAPTRPPSGFLAVTITTHVVPSGCTRN
jgi:hypothetical protein